MQHGEIPCNSAVLDKVIAKINGDNFVSPIFFVQIIYGWLWVRSCGTGIFFIFELFSYLETVTKSCSEKRAVTRIFRNFVEKQFWHNSNFRRFNIAVNSQRWKFCKVFRNSYLVEYLQAAASCFTSLLYFNIF